jgi:succinyl-CoA synthetase beta subunit
VATAIIRVAEKTGIKVPVIIRLEGTNAESAGEILKGSGMNFQLASTFNDVLSCVSDYVKPPSCKVGLARHVPAKNLK